MKLSADGLARLTQREGSRAAMYRDSAGLPTIGVGHLLTKDELSSGKIKLPSGSVDWHCGLTAVQIAELLARDTVTAEATITAVLMVGLTQGQFDSLVSFVFNVGTGAFRGSTLLRHLNAGDYASIPAQLRRWVYAAGAVDHGLVKRREDEIKQWEAA